MLFKYIEEINMPSLMHCIRCDKPGILANGLCNNCYQINEEDSEPTTADEYNKEWLDENKSRTKI